MEEYIFYTTTKKYLKLYSRIILKQKIELIFIIGILFVLFPLFAFYMIFNKPFKNRVKELIEDIKELNKRLFVNHDSYGFYEFQSKNISIDLEAHNIGRDSRTIKEIIKTTIHEDLHKALNDIGINIGKHHFGIEKMGY